MDFLPAELIKKKRAGFAHSKDEIAFLVREFSEGRLPEYQMSAWLMAVYFKGMTDEETANLTEAMMRSGEVLSFSPAVGFTVDKHSTGGVGDKASLILAPIAAAAGVPVPMIAGRGLGHTGGTLDKLEAIPGFRIDLTLSQFKSQVEKLGLAIIGQTAEICPADRKMYALRDVTATVESMPLICGSIMSKKLAEGIRGLVLDVKFGNGAFMKTEADAKTLAKNLMAIGTAQGRKVVSFITDMSQPLGRFAGNACEIHESLAILKQSSYGGFELKDFADTQALSVELAGAMIWIGKKADSIESGRQLALDILTSGKAYSKFCEIVAAQGGTLDAIPSAQKSLEVFSPTQGFVSEIATESVGISLIQIGAGRAKVTDKIDPTAGIAFHKKIGDAVAPHEKLFTLFGSDRSRLEKGRDDIVRAIKISLQKPKVPTLIVDRIL